MLITGTNLFEYAASVGKELHLPKDNDYLDYLSSIPSPIMYGVSPNGRKFVALHLYVQFNNSKQLHDVVYVVHQRYTDCLETWMEASVLGTPLSILPLRERSLRSYSNILDNRSTDNFVIFYYGKAKLYKCVINDEVIVYIGNVLLVIVLMLFVCLGLYVYFRYIRCYFV